MASSFVFLGTRYTFPNIQLVRLYYCIPLLRHWIQWLRYQIRGLGCPMQQPIYQIFIPWIVYPPIMNQSGSSFLRLDNRMQLISLWMRSPRLEIRRPPIMIEWPWMLINMGNVSWWTSQTTLSSDIGKASDGYLTVLFGRCWRHMQ